MIGLLLMIGVCSCDVHEFPTDNGLVNPEQPEDPETPTVEPGNEIIDPSTPTYTVHFSFKYDTDMVIYPQTIDIESRAATMKMRHTIRFYSGHELESGGSDAPLYSYVFVSDISEVPDFTKYLKLPIGDYTCVIWSEYVNNDATDLYYNIADFHEIYIHNKESYTACTDYKDGFWGIEKFSVSEGSNDVVVSLKRPFAKYEIVTTDLIEYIAETQSISASNVNINDYSISVHYSGYTPCAFNLISGRSTDSWAGLWYTGKPTHFTSDYQDFKSDNDDILLASDYIFVNERETSVDLFFEISNRLGDIVFQSAKITIPLLRSVDTVVMATIRSESSSSGAIINPNYEGDFNIEF
jgi:hypothetical protein